MIKFFSFLLLAGSPTAAMAAETYTLLLTAQQVDVIGTGLGKLPLEISGAVFAEVQKQVQQQQQQQMRPKATKKGDSDE